MNVKNIVTYLRHHPLHADILWLCVLVFPAIIALINPHYFSMHDDQHIARLYVFDKALREGNIYSRWVDILGFGYGYPLFNFYPPLIYIVGELFHFMGFSFIWSMKMVLITGFIGAAIGMYWYAKAVFNRYAGLLAAILYTYFTYHAVGVYVRGAFAEFFSLVVLPYLFLSLKNMAEKRTVYSAILFAIAFSLLILTHQLIAVPALFFIAAYIGYYYWRTRQEERKTFLRMSIIGGVLGLSLSAFFWLPALVEKRFTYVDALTQAGNAVSFAFSTNYSAHFLCIEQFWYSAWGYGGSSTGCTDGMSFQLGKIHIGLVGASLVLFCVSFISKKVSKERATEIMFYTFLLIVSLFMTLTYSEGVWKVLSFLWYLQFPWRFLTFAAVFISLVGAGGCYFLMKLPFPPKIWRERLALCFLLLGSLSSVLVYSKYFVPQYQREVTDRDMTSYKEVAWRVSRTSFEFIPKGVKTKKTAENISVIDIDESTLPQSSYKLVSGRGLVQEHEIHSTQKSFIVKQGQPVVFQLNTFNFPGWEAYLTKSFNNASAQKLVIDDNNGLKLIRVTLPPGEYILTFVFRDTPIRMIANTLTVLSFVGIILYYYRDTRYLKQLFRKLKQIQR